MLEEYQRQCMNISQAETLVSNRTYPYRLSFAQKILIAIMETAAALVNAM